jgi:hypothetical protein
MLADIHFFFAEHDATGAEARPTGFEFVTLERAVARRGVLHATPAVFTHVETRAELET